MTFLWGLVSKERVAAMMGLVVIVLLAIYRKMGSERKEHTFTTFPFLLFPFTFSALWSLTHTLISLLEFSNKSLLLIFPFTPACTAFYYGVIYSGLPLK